MGWQRETGWKRFDERGEERAAFACADGACGLEGMGAVAINGSGLVFQYRIEFSPGWEVRRAGAVARLGAEEFTLAVERGDEGGWLINGIRAHEFDECLDLDLSFSPSTNTATIKRLALRVGEGATSNAILVHEPELTLSVLEQTYHRVDERQYEYRAGEFVAMIEVDEDELVSEYPGMFRALAAQVAG